MSVKKSNVVNLTGGVTTKDGRTLYGMDAELYLKMQAKEDPEWERKIAEWIETVLEKPLESPDLSISLKSGIVLCRLVNKFRPGIIPKFNDAAQIHPLMEVENINLYLKACWRLGVPSSDLFSVADLHMARGMPSVLQNLASLSRIAKNSLGYQGDVIGPNVNPVPNNPTRHWDVVIPGKVNVVDLIDDGAESLVEVRQRLQLAQAHAEELQKQLSDLKSENEMLKATGSAGASSNDESGGSGGSSSNLQQLFERTQHDTAKTHSIPKALEGQCRLLGECGKELRLDNEALRRTATSAANQTNSTIQELRSELDLARQETTKQKNQYEEQISELRKAKEAMVQEANRLRSASTTSRQAALDNSAQIAKLEEEWQAKLKREVAKTQAQLRALQEQNQDLEASISEMREENENLRRQATTAEADRSSVVAYAQSLKKELEDTKNELQNALSKQSSSGEVPAEKVAEIENSWKRQLAEKELRYSSQFSALEAELKALENQIHGLQEENTTLKEKPTAVAAPVPQITNAAEQAAAAAARAAAERAARNEEAARVELNRLQQDHGQKVEALLQQQARLREEIDQLSSERDRLLSSLKRQEDAAHNQATSFKVEIEQLKKKTAAEIESLKAEVEAAETRLASLQRDKARLQQKLDEKSTLDSAASIDAEQAQAREEELNKEIAALREEVEDTRNQMLRRTREVESINMSLQRQLLTLDKELRAAKNDAEAKEATISAQVRTLEDQLKDVEKRDATNKLKYEQQLDEMKHEQELLTRTNQDLLQSNEQLKKELEGLRATLATAAMASGDRSTLTPAQKRRATILAEPIDPKPEDLPLQSPRKTTSASANSERMSLMLPSSPISSSTTRGASASIVEVANHNKRGSHERQMSGPESLSQLSRQVTRKNVNAKMDSSLLNIKAQLESGGSSPSTSEPGSPQQPKPQQQQHQQMFYEKEIDDNLLLFCRESLDTIIQGSGNVVYDDMSQINQLFKFDTGRRLFAFLLQYFSNRKEQQLQPEGFEVLLFLYNSCLNELAASDTNDWNTLSLLMDTSCLFFQRSHNGNKEYMKDILRTHFIWQNADYWESNFWSQFTADYRAAFGDAAGASSSSTNDAKSRLFIQNKKQKEWVMEQLKTFCATMSYWGMTQEQTRHFVATISNYVGLAEDSQKEILVKVEKAKESTSPKSEKTPKSPRGGDKKKSKWF